MTAIPRVALGDLVTITGGGTPLRSNPAYFDGDIPWVTPKDMKAPELCDSLVHITERGLRESATKLVPPGSVLVVVRSGVLKHSVPIAINRVPVALNQDMKALSTGPMLQPEYLAHYLRARTPEILRWVRATTADNFPVERLRDLEVPLPPLAEQRRVAAILDRAEGLRARRRQAVALLDALVHSIFTDMFGDPGRNERSWPVATVSGYVAAFQGGKSMEADAGETTDATYRILKISAVTGMRFQPEESKPVPSWYEPRDEHFVKAGDLLFSRANTAELVGAVAQVAACSRHLLLPDKLWRFVWKQPSVVHPTFVRVLFQMPAVRAEISRRATGTGGSMKNISKEKLLAMATILPPLGLQERFASRIVVLESMRAYAVAAAKGLEDLFASLQHRAFRGEL